MVTKNRKHTDVILDDPADSDAESTDLDADPEPEPELSGSYEARRRLEQIMEDRELRRLIEGDFLD